MAKFDSILTPATNKASRLISAQMRRQAPKDTGALRSSVKVKLTRTGDLEKGFTFTYTTEFLKYGIYTDLGTGNYGVSETQRGNWNPKPGKGKGGIKPRFWLSLADSIKDPILQDLAEAVADAKINDIQTQIMKIYEGNI
jgi:hypothetical protein